MSRQPIPGQDDGTWGDILNDYLAQTHDADGTQKSNTIGTGSLQDNAVTDAKVASGIAQSKIANLASDLSAKYVKPAPGIPKADLTASVQASLDNADAAVAGTAPDSSTTTKGLVKLAGDLAGTATLPTVPGLAGKEPTVTAGTTSQYYRGDKSWQTLDKSTVALGNVDNTSDANKPISSATQTALNAKLVASNNLSDLANAVTARTNLGLGSAATQASSAFDAAGAAAAVQATVISGSKLTRTVVKSANYSALANDLVPVDTTSTAVTITLPTAPADKTSVGVKVVGPNPIVNAVTIAAAGSDVFNKSSGATTLILAYLTQYVQLQYDSTSAVWTVVTDESPEAILGTNVQGAYVHVADRLTAIEASISAGAGSPGAAGAEIAAFGPVDDTVVGVTGDVYGPFVAPVSYTIQSPIAAALRGGVASGDTSLDIELCSSGIAGPWTSIFTGGNNPTILAGNLTALSLAPSTTALSPGGAIRAKILSAPTAGGSFSYPATANSAGDGTTTAVITRNIPIPTGYAAGDLLVCVLGAVVDTVTWPTGWAGVLLAASPKTYMQGNATGTYYLHVGTKTASAGESASQAVTFSSSTCVMASYAVRNGSIDLGLSAATDFNSGATTGNQTPAITTTVDGSILAHVVLTRPIATNIGPGTVTLTGNTVEIQPASLRASGVNLGIAIAHETQVTHGAVTRRTAAWTNSSRSVIGTLVLTPSAGTAPVGPELIVRLVH